MVDERGELALDGAGDVLVGGVDADAEDGAGGLTVFGGAAGEVLLPLGVRDGVGEQGGPFALGGLVAAFGEFVGLEVVDGAEALEIGHNDDLGQLALLALSAFDRDGEAALEDAEQRAELSAGGGREGEADGEDDVGVHPLHAGGGKVFENAAVDVLVTVHGEGLVDAGKGDGGAHGVGDGAAGEGDGFGVGEVGGDAAERDGEGVEVDAVVVAEEAAVEEGVEALVGEDGVAEGDAVAEADGKCVGEGAGVFAAAEGAAGVGGPEAEDLTEDGVVHDDFEAVDGDAGGVEGADHAAHAGSGDDVDGDVVLFEPLEDADFGEGEGAAATEGKADARATDGTGRGDGGGEGVAGGAADGRLGIRGGGGLGAFAGVLSGAYGLAGLGRGFGGGGVRCGWDSALLAEEGEGEQKEGYEAQRLCRQVLGRGAALNPGSTHVSDGMGRGELAVGRMRLRYTEAVTEAGERWVGGRARAIDGCVCLAGAVSLHHQSEAGELFLHALEIAADDLKPASRGAGFAVGDAVAACDQKGADEFTCLPGVEAGFSELFAERGKVRGGKGLGSWFQGRPRCLPAAPTLAVG